jgi:hypothetical protein
MSIRVWELQRDYLATMVRPGFIREAGRGVSSIVHGNGLESQVRHATTGTSASHVFRIYLVFYRFTHANYAGASQCKGYVGHQKNWSKTALMPDPSPRLRSVWRLVSLVSSPYPPKTSRQQQHKVRLLCMPLACSCKHL